MNYLIIESGIIANIIVAEPEVAKALGAYPEYPGARIGEAYNPPPPEPDEQTQTRLAIAELAETEARHDLENKLAIAELAETVLGGVVNG